MLAFAVSVGLGGCATASRSRSVSNAADRERERDQTIAALRARNAGDARHIEELENRIFILEDRLDSRRLAAEQRGPATLPPRARLGRDSPGAAALGAPVSAVPAPAPRTQESNGATPGATDDGESSLLAEQEVEYAGEALSGADGKGTLGRTATTHRPLLRLGAPEPALGPHSQETPASPEPLRVYRHALESLRAGHQKVALSEFRRFLDGNPRHDYADNAQYWIGECYYDLHDFGAAEPEFRRVIDRYPHGNKVPDAMLKLGFTLLAEGDEDAGLKVLESLTRAFPMHEAARLASFRLAHPEPPVSRGQVSPMNATLGTIVPPAPIGALEDLP